MAQEQEKGTMLNTGTIKKYFGSCFLFKNTKFILLTLNILLSDLEKRLGLLLQNKLDAHIVKSNHQNGVLNQTAKTTPHWNIKYYSL